MVVLANLPANTGALLGTEKLLINDPAESPPERLIDTKLITGNLLIKRAFAASLTFDFASIASDAVATQTVTVTGALVGDHVIVTEDIFTTGLTYAARVSATNTVEVRAANTSAGAVNPASTVFSILVIGTT